MRTPETSQDLLLAARRALKELVMTHGTEQAFACADEVDRCLTGLFERGGGVDVDYLRRERDEATRTRDAACMQELRTRKAMQRLADQEGPRYGDPLRALVPPSHEKMLRCVWGDVHGPHECIVGGMVAAQSLWRCVIGGRPNSTFAVTDLNGCVLWNEQDAEDGGGDGGGSTDG